MEEAQQLKKHSVTDVIDQVVVNEAELPPIKSPHERIIMGGELSDIEFNYAQQLLKANHPKLNGCHSTWVIRKMAQFENSIQIVHCAARHHWILATTVDCKLGEVKIFDSIFFNCDKETMQTMHTLFYLILEHPTITMCRCQKQAGTTDLGIFDCLHSGPGLWKEPWQAEVSSG